ncbi:ATP-binding protein [Actinocorallia sp. API 0066]|uniref:AAA family ATPase n=1 Tax=Actinocorallia sp. API 0066 TaxID=2896846 RepID=UPI001E3170E1|nr:AAA family ATPase [Actinocorallia sp. API 0066]MCD0450467.1 ATP-binding protein [Actinocorallia sp. API 0066]
MPIRDCRVIAVEGTHASGKTTLVHALTSHYREQGVHVACTGEPARFSPFMEEIVLHGKGTFDLVAELDAFGAHLTTQLRAARNQTLLITDKTLLNVAAYARMLLPPSDHPVIDAMLRLCASTTHLYDAVLYTSDTFSPWQPGDRFRDKVADQQAELDLTLRSAADEIDLPLTPIPRGLTTAERVSWVSARLAQTGVQPALA